MAIYRVAVLFQGEPLRTRSVAVRIKNVHRFVQNIFTDNPDIAQIEVRQRHYDNAMYFDRAKFEGAGHDDES